VTSMREFITIAGRQIGAGQPCFVIAEAGVNHNGSLEMALRLVDAAKAAGADAVKFQTFRAEEVVTANAPKAEYQKRTTGGDESQLEMIAKLELPPVAFARLAEHCAAAGIVFLSTPFDFPSADLLEQLQVPAFKIPSGEITNGPLLRHIAAKKKPLIMSTGMADLGEVREAVREVTAAGVDQLALLQCTSSYPAPPASVNLRAMKTLADAFKVPVGFSDHTEGIEVALAAVALGACVIEKHFTLDRSLPGPDQRSSLEPVELDAMVRGIRKVEAALGSAAKSPATEELNTRDVARRSLVAARALPAGTVLDESMIVIRRPGTGLPPNMLNKILGRRLKRAVESGALLASEMFES